MTGRDPACGEPDHAIYERIAPALDRFQEAHFWIHGLEGHYHSADLFRWHLNVFLKAIKEVPQLVSMVLQNEPNFLAWFKPKRANLNADPLLGVLSKRRDFVVHQGMLVLGSKGTIGITRGRGIKLGMGFPVHPLEDSDDAMDRYIEFAAENGDFFGFLDPHDEDTMPCVRREWRLPEFEEELVEVCARAWLRTGETLQEVVGWLGGASLPLSLSCRHSSDRVQMKLYNRSKVHEKLERARAGRGR